MFSWSGLLINTDGDARAPEGAMAAGREGAFSAGVVRRQGH